MKSFSIKAISLTVAASCVMYLGCKKSYIDLLPRNPTELSYFLTEGEFTKGILGVYAKMSDIYGLVNIDNIAGPEASRMTIFLLPGDDLTTNNSNEEFEIFSSIQGSSGRISYLYKAIYQLIARANVMLQKNAEVADGIYVTAGLKDYHRGEALFLRGFMYYYLWTYFGTSPLNIERVVSEAQFTPPGTTGTQLLDQAIADFTEAATLLPASWDATNRGRATKNSAFGFLGKSLVFKASATNSLPDYTSALAAFTSISGASLVEKFDDNFAPDTENNSESLFEFQAAGAAGGNNMWLPNDFDNAIGNLAVDWNFLTGNELYGMSQFYATTKLLDAFEPSDPRLPLTLDPSDRTINKYVLRDALLDGYQPASLDNYRLLRLADVKLLQAEATLQSNGSTTAAINFINEVRTRARNMNGGSVPANYNNAETDKTTIMNWIMNERLIELAAEGQRWPDLRRWQMQGIITLNNAFFSSSVGTVSFQSPKHLLMPIPTSEIDINPNVPQNTGY